MEEAEGAMILLSLVPALVVVQQYQNLGHAKEYSQVWAILALLDLVKVVEQHMVALLPDAWVIFVGDLAMFDHKAHLLLRMCDMKNESSSVAMCDHHHVVHICVFVYSILCRILDS